MTTQFQIHQEIVSIMNTLKGTGQPFNEVFPYPEANPEVFPYAMIDIGDSASQRDEASRTKIFSSSFVVRCLFRQKTNQAATEQRLQALDAVIAKFTELGVADYLNNTVTKMDFRVSPFAVDAGDQPVFGFDLIIDCEVVMDIQ